MATNVRVASVLAFRNGAVNDTSTSTLPLKSVSETPSRCQLTIILFPA